MQLDKLIEKGHGVPGPEGPDINRRLFEKIKSEIKGTEKEAFIRRIITKLSLNPKISNLWFSLGLLLSEVEKYEYANEAFNRVVVLNPGHKKLWNAKAMALSQLGRHDEASECFKKSLEGFSGKLRGYSSLKEFQQEIRERKDHFGLGDFDDASIDFLTANILDLDSFISELEMLLGNKKQDEIAYTVDQITSKLDELEKMD
ncbi:MAG: hypothetical protein JSV56_01625 [Methanomassiliicoccales archaeon]|nr:MAG: hypothetical protein JSV56_01625 [Methanomassiliicoccales archaeon]